MAYTVLRWRELRQDFRVGQHALKRGLGDAEATSDLDRGKPAVMDQPVDGHPREPEHARCLSHRVERLTVH